MLDSRHDVAISLLGDFFQLLFNVFVVVPGIEEIVESIVVGAFIQAVSFSLQLELEEVEEIEEHADEAVTELRPEDSDLVDMSERDSGDGMPFRSVDKQDQEDLQEVEPADLVGTIEGKTPCSQKDAEHHQAGHDDGHIVVVVVDVVEDIGRQDQKEAHREEDDDAIEDVHS